MTTTQGPSTSTALAAGGSFVSDGFIDGKDDVLITCKSDADGVLKAEFSQDNTNWDSSLSFNVGSNIYEIHRLIKGHRYFRVRYLNGSDAQGYLRLETSFGMYGPLTTPLNLSVGGDADSIVTTSIGEEIAIADGRFTTYQTINKFGRNRDVDNAADVWSLGGEYTGFPLGVNQTVSILSSNAQDISGAGVGFHSIRVFGLGSDYDIIQEDIQLNGSIPVATTNQFSRVNRMYGLTAGASGLNIGSITARHTTSSGVLAHIFPLTGQTEQAIYTIPKGYTGFIKEISAGLNDNTTNNAVLGYWIRESGTNPAVRLVKPFTVSTTFESVRNVYGGIKLPEKTDIKLRVLSINNANGDLSADFDILLSKN